MYSAGSLCAWVPGGVGRACWGSGAPGEPVGGALEETQDVLAVSVHQGTAGEKVQSAKDV